MTWPGLALLVGIVSVGSRPLVADGAPADSDDSGTISEIVVTAQKRAESVMSVPVAVTALSSEMLANVRPQSPTDLAALVPSLSVSNPLGDTAPVYSLRGISMSDYSVNQGGPIAPYVDEVYRVGPTFFSKQIYDLERIEVLSGPQGTLYGRNATGGAINFVTTRPGFDTKGYLTVGAGNYNEREAAGALQGGLTDTVAARLAFTVRRIDGWQPNDYPGSSPLGQDRGYGVRLSLLYRPNDAVEAILRLADSQTGPSNSALLTLPGPVGIGAGLYASFRSAYPTLNTQSDFFRTGLCSICSDSNSIARTDTAARDASLNVTWHINDNLDLTSISSYDTGRYSYTDDSDGSPLSLLTDLFTSYGQQFAEELRLTSKSHGPLEYLIGAYYGGDRQHLGNSYGYATDINFKGYGQIDSQDCLAALGMGLSPFGCVQRNDFRQKRQSAAAYFDASFRLAEAMRVRFGARYTRDQLDVDGYSATTYGADGTALFNTIPGDPTDPQATSASIRRTYNKATGRIGLDYTLPQGGLIYATASRGYRSGAVNSQAYNGPDELTFAAPETLDAGELGFKSIFFDRRLQLTAAAFYYRYHNQQVLNLDPATFHQTLVNYARSHIEGAELQLVGKPLEALTVRLGISRLQSRVDEATVSGVDIAGNQLVLSPKFTGNLGAEWRALTTTAGALSLYSDVRYIASQFQDLFNTEQIRTSPYAIANARATFQLQNAPVSFSLWGKNLADKRFVTYANYAIPAFGLNYFHLGDPRTYGATVTWTF
jgi:iron complex outermembrane receptor protein